MSNIPDDMFDIMFNAMPPILQQGMRDAGIENIKNNLDKKQKARETSLELKAVNNIEKPSKIIHLKDESLRGSDEISTKE